MRARMMVIAVLILTGVWSVSAQETSTPTPTPTPTFTPTPTPDFADFWEMGDGQDVTFIYEVTPADYARVPLLIGILLSMWAAFFLFVFILRRRD